MVDFGVIIPSANAENLVPCVRALMENEPDLDPSKIVVIDDGAFASAAARMPGVTWIRGIKPFIYARNCNLGIRMLGDSDVVLLNDDAILTTPFGLSKIGQNIASWGLVSACTNSGNRCQVKQGTGIRFEGNRCPAFVCAYIPRTTIDCVGLLDERFTAYGWEDNDYVRRVRNAGLTVGVSDDCFVDHSSLQSTFHNSPMGRDIVPGREIFEAKWGKGAE